MPFLLIDFPVFNPIAVQIGPIAIRWYALAYIGGIVLGWLYARALIKNGNRKLSGGYIALQSESHPIEFRKVELLPLAE